MTESMASQFHGGVFHASIPDGRAGAEIECTAQKVIAQTSTGHRFAIPYTDCGIEIGGASGRMVFCRNGDRSVTIFCEDKRFPAALREAAGGLLDGALGGATQERKAGIRAERRFLGGIVLATILALVIGWFAIAAAARASIRALPLSVDQQIGKLAWSSMDKQGQPLADEEVVTAVRDVVQRLVAQSRYPDLVYEVAVIDADICNAFALPGGHVVVYAGLLRKAPSGDAVAGVLAHEIAHVTERHGLESVAGSIGLVIAIQVLAGDVGGLTALGAQVAQHLALTSYSREKEAEADRVGVDLLHRTGIDPRGLAAFFAVLQDEETSQDHVAIPEWASTHPDHAHRIDDITALVDALPPTTYSPAFTDWERLRARLVAAEVPSVPVEPPATEPIEEPQP